MPGYIAVLGKPSRVNLPWQFSDTTGIACACCTESPTWSAQGDRRTLGPGAAGCCCSVPRKAATGYGHRTSAASLATRVPVERAQGVARVWIDGFLWRRR
jgi:hypothetical protein